MAKGDPRLGNGGVGYFPAVYQSALAQTAEDYDSIMGDYENLETEAKNRSNDNSRNIEYNPISPTFTSYQPGSDYSELRNIAETGGYSEGDINSIRERAISPIRSVYSNAQRGLDRQKNLSGGYAPNFAAASAKMARESSNLISDKTTHANASIADMVQKGKLAGATALAPLEARENEFRNTINMRNTDIANQIAELNAKYGMAAQERNKVDDNNDFDNILKTIQGKQSLFGTTPANMSTIGNQVLSAANVANNFAPIVRGSGSSTMPRPNPNLYSLNKPKIGANYGA